MAKHKLIIKEESKSNTNNKPKVATRYPLQDILPFNRRLGEDSDVVTMKQVNESERGKRVVVPKCQTDRI